jgi:hypothetical protein
MMFLLTYAILLFYSCISDGFTQIAQSPRLNHIPSNVAHRIWTTRLDGFSIRKFLSGMFIKKKGIGSVVRLGEDFIDVANATSVTIVDKMNWNEDAPYFDEIDEPTLLKDSVIKSWDGMSEDANYFDEADSLDDDHEFWESPLVSAASALDLTASHDNKASHESYPNSAPIVNEKSQQIPSSPNELVGLIKGWDNFSEEPPYYDDDYLLLDEDLYGIREESSRTRENARLSNRFEAAGEDVDDSEQYVIRDQDGTRLGWSDWSENEASYFDESFADTETTFGEKLISDKLLSEKSHTSLNQPLQALQVRKNSRGARGSAVEDFPKFEGATAQGEWTDWDTEAFVGEDTDFGPDV